MGTLVLKLPVRLGEQCALCIEYPLEISITLSIASIRNFQGPLCCQTGVVQHTLGLCGFDHCYRRIVDLLREDEVENVAFVWHSYAATPFGGRPVTAWWPGAEYVDWVGISLFGHMYSSRPSRDLEAVLDFALQQRKPVMVGEATPTEGISERSDRAWNTWFVNLFSFAYAKNIKAISLINEDWRRFTFTTRWGDARLQNNDRVAEAFFMETNAPRYLKQSPELFETLGYTPPGER